jgi:superfamily II DNA or RNA helicase
LPTGAGKTVVLAALISRTAKRCLVVVHRQELVAQTRAKLEDAGASATVATVQGLLASGSRPEADLAIYDEAHHYSAREWRSVTEGYPLRLGLTATPQRGDGTALDVFDRLVVGSTIGELTELGHLVPCDVWAPPGSGATLYDPAEAYARVGDGRPWVAFCESVPHAEALAAELGGEVVHGGLPDEVRRARLEAFAAGATNGLASVHVLTEGWDCPRAEVCLLARGAGSASTYLQMVGRVLRPHPGKTSALLIDCKGSVHRHGLPSQERSWSLEGKAHSVQTAAVRQCPRCGACHEPRPTCPRCGHVYPPPEPPKPTRWERLERIREVATADTRRAYYEAQVAIGKARGYKPGWARYRYKDRYGVWPER